MGKFLEPSGAGSPGEGCLFQGCGRLITRREYCVTHYEYLRRRGVFNGVPLSHPTDLERFESKVDRSAGPDSCHPWTASLDENGYGFFKYQGKMWRATRWYYHHQMQKLPDDLVVRHICDNPICVNPRHLTHGTKQQNAQDASERGRFPNRKGEANPRAKLTVAQAKAIRASKNSALELASQYQVSRNLIYMIRRGEIWQ